MGEQRGVEPARSIGHCHSRRLEVRSAGAYDAARVLADGRVGASVLLGDVAQGAGAKAVRPANDRDVFFSSPTWSASHGGRKHSHPRSPGLASDKEGRNR